MSNSEKIFHDGKQPVTHCGYTYITEYSKEEKELYTGEVYRVTERWWVYRSKIDGSGERKKFIFHYKESEWYKDDEISTDYYGTERIISELTDRYGQDALFEDFAPYFPSFSFTRRGDKWIIYDVYDSGAAEILKEGVQSSRADREIIKQEAVKLLTEAGRKEDESKEIISSFVKALGWN